MLQAVRRPSASLPPYVSSAQRGRKRGKEVGKGGWGREEKGRGRGAGRGEEELGGGVGSEDGGQR